MNPRRASLRSRVVGQSMARALNQLRGLTDVSPDITAEELGEHLSRLRPRLERLAAADVHSVGGMAVGAVPLVAAALAVADRRGYPLEGFFVRKQAKEHGTARQIDGRFDAAVAHALVEDVVTTGGSTLAALDAVEGAGGRVETIVTVVDREEPPGIDALRARVADTSALVTRSRIVAAARWNSPLSEVPGPGSSAW